MSKADEFLSKLPTISWRSPTLVTAQALVLIEDFLGKIKASIKYVMTTLHLPFEEAFATVLSAGGSSSRQAELVDLLYSRTVFANAGVRETLIHPILSALLWEDDPVCKATANPWLPCLDLYVLGYTTDYEIDPDHVDWKFGYNNGEVSYRIEV